MPSANIKSFAEKSGKSPAEVEKIWDETKVEAGKKFKSQDEHFWAYVNKTTQYKLGIAVKEGVTTFKGFLLQEKESCKICVGDTVQLLKPLPKIEDSSEGEVFTVADVAENGDVKINHSFGPEHQDTYFPSKLFKKVTNDSAEVS